MGKAVAGDLAGPGRFGQIHQNGHLDLTGGDHVDVDAGVVQGLEHLGGHAGVMDHAGAHDGHLGDGVVDVDMVEAKRALVGLQNVLGAVHILLAHGEADVLGVVAADGLKDDIHVHLLLRQQREDLKGDTGLVGQPHNGQTGHVLVAGHPADVHFFHGICNLLDFGAGLAGEAGEDLQIDAVAFGHFHRAVVQDLGAQGGQLQHLVVSDLFQLEGAGHMAGIGGEHAVHIGVDLAQVGPQGGGQRHGGGIGAAPAQGGDVVVLVQALEAGHDDDGLLIQLRQHALGVQPLDAGVSVDRVGAESGLPARQGDDRVAHGLDGHGTQRAGDLLAGGEEHIHLPLGTVGVDLGGLGDQVVGGIPLGGKHGHHAVAPAVGLGDDAGHVADAVCISHGAAAEFLYNESHWRLYPLNQVKSLTISYALSPAHGTRCRA